MERDNRRQRLGIGGLGRIAIFTLLSTLAAVSSGQDAEKDGQEPLVSKAAQGTASRFLVHSDLVLVPVTVTEGNGRGVTGLAKEHFSILEDRVPQVITHFTAEDAPATIGLVFDASDSMGPKLSAAQDAVYAVLRNANPQDEYFLIRFSHRPELTVGLTKQTDEIRRAVQRLQVSGSTALLDAMNMAWLEMKSAHHRRKAIILISDGEDNSSRMSRTEFKQLATESDTTVYSLFIGSSPDVSLVHQGRKLEGAPLLDDLARQTGGRMFVVSELNQLPKISARIGSWVRSQYVLGYVPRDESRNGGYHRIQVKISKPAGFPRLHSSWRLGYHAPKP